MKYAISVTDINRAEEIEANGRKIIEKVEQYGRSLQKLTSYEEPRGYVFHDWSSATEIYSTIPLPAYTSRDLIHITPLLDVWKTIFLDSAGDVVQAIDYSRQLDLDDIAVIAAHELTHHADLFHDDFDEIDEENMWFEEGMCFYLPRRFMLSREKFDSIMEVEQYLIEAYRHKYGEYTLNRFGACGYRGGQNQEYSAAFYDYWRSTRVIYMLVEHFFDRDISGLIGVYQKWTDHKPSIPLHQYLKETFNLSRKEAQSLWLSEKG